MEIVYHFKGYACILVVRMQYDCLCYCMHECVLGVVADVDFIHVKTEFVILSKNSICIITLSDIISKYVCIHL